MLGGNEVVSIVSGHEDVRLTMEFSDLLKVSKLAVVNIMEDTTMPILKNNKYVAIAIARSNEKSG